MRSLHAIVLASSALPLLAVALGGCAGAPPPVLAVVVSPPIAVDGPDEEAPPAGFGRVARVAAGFEGRIYALPEGTARLPDFGTMQPMGSIYTSSLDVTPRAFDQGFPGVTDRFEWFGIDYQGTFTVAVEGDYLFRLTADDGAKLLIDGKAIIENDGVHPPTAVEGTVHLTVGAHRIHVPYFQGPRVMVALVLEVSPIDEQYHLFRIDRPLGGSTDDHFPRPPRPPPDPHSY
jgi:hypothetical protein